MRTLILLLLISIIIQLEGKSQFKTSNLDPLIDIVQAVEKKHLNIDEWEIVYRDNINNDKKKRLTSFLTNQNETTVKVKDDYLIYELTQPIKTINGHIVYQLTTANRYEDISNVTIKLTGKRYFQNETLQEIIQTLHKFNHFLTHSPTIFTCLTARNDDIIIDGISNQKIAGHLNTLHSFTQFDENIKSKYVEETYGYNPQWEEVLLIEND